MKEIWKEISGFAGYKISDSGKIKNKKNHILHPYKGTILLYRDKVPHSRKVSKLVDETMRGE